MGADEELYYECSDQQLGPFEAVFGLRHERHLKSLILHLILLQWPAQLTR